MIVPWDTGCVQPGKSFYSSKMKWIILTEPSPLWSLFTIFVIHDLVLKYNVPPSSDRNQELVKQTEEHMGG